MRQSAKFLTIASLVTQVFSAPQFITFDNGKLGVNFGGYHAGVGIGGAAGKGAAGGLFAEAGTPFGQAARAGLGGDVAGSGSASGGLYAGATAGGNVRAEAGLSGAVAGDKSVGSGFANAQAGKAHAASGLGGETSGAGSHGFTFSSSKSFTGSTGVVKHTEVVKEKEFVPVPVQPIEIVKPTYKKIHKEFKLESANEVKPEIQVRKEFTEFVPLEEQVPSVPPTPVVVKEVSTPWIESRNQFDYDYDRSIRSNFFEPFNFGDFFDSMFRMPQPVYDDREWWGQRQRTFVRPEQVVYQPIVYEKHVRSKPRHHFRKTAFLGGYIGAQGAVAPPPPPPPPPAPVVYKTVQPVIQKRIDVVSESAAAPCCAGVDADTYGAGQGQVAYTKQVTFQRNPNFFADIFNIPISTLKAVGNFLGNTAAGTSVSVQKSASVQADSDGISPDPNSSVMSMGGLTIQTPTASKFIDDIFAIPINTLGAVNKFLENNVPARTQVVSGDSAGAPTKIRLGPHARRRANQQVVYREEAPAEAEHQSY